MALICSRSLKALQPPCLLEAASIPSPLSCSSPGRNSHMPPMLELLLVPFFPDFRSDFSASIPPRELLPFFDGDLGTSELERERLLPVRLSLSECDAEEEIGEGGGGGLRLEFEDGLEFEDSSGVERGLLEVVEAAVFPLRDCSSSGKHDSVTVRSTQPRFVPSAPRVLAYLPLLPASPTGSESFTNPARTRRPSSPTRMSTSTTRIVTGPNAFQLRVKADSATGVGMK